MPGVSTTDRLEILDLLARVVHTGDSGDLDTYATLLADDVVWAMPGVEHRGRDAVLDGIRARHAAGTSGPRSGTRHVLTTTMIDLDGDHAHATSTWLLVGADDTSDGAPVLRRVGTYHDDLRRVDGRWLLAARRILFGTRPG